MNAGIKADPKEKFPKGKQTRDIMGAKMGVSGKQYEKLKTINKNEKTMRTEGTIHARNEETGRTGQKFKILRRIDAPG